jgi:hypothetical protein
VPAVAGHAQKDLKWTAADATELDLAAAPNGGYTRGSNSLVGYAL